MKNLRLLLVSVIAGQALCGPPAVFAERNSDPMDKPLKSSGDNMKGPGAHVHEYDEIVSPDMETARSVANRARVSLKNGNVSRALALAQRAMKMDDDDMEIHFIYAQALEAKVERQTERDPYLYKKCIQEWIKVYRNEVGMEKGMTFKGLNVMGNLYNDDEYGNVAKKHLVRLTGYAPKLWETDNHFITRMTKEVQTSVSAKVKTSPEGEEEEEVAAPAKPRRVKAPQD